MQGRGCICRKLVWRRHWCRAGRGRFGAASAWDAVSAASCGIIFGMAPACVVAGGLSDDVACMLWQGRCSAIVLCLWHCKERHLLVGGNATFVQTVSMTVSGMTLCSVALEAAVAERAICMHVSFLRMSGLPLCEDREENGGTVEGGGTWRNCPRHSELCSMWSHLRLPRVELTCTS